MNRVAVVLAGILLCAAGPRNEKVAEIYGASANLSRSLLGYWKLNEGQGTVTKDSSGHGFTGTLVSSSWIFGKFGIGVSTSSNSSSMIVVSNKTIVSSLQTWTISAWVKFTGGNTHQVLYGERGTAGNDIVKIQTQNGNPNVTIRNDANSIVQITGSPLISDGNWHMVSATKGLGLISLYSDGTLVGSGADPAGNYTDSTANSEIGNDNQSENAQNLDDVRLYNRALSATEIRQLYYYIPY